MTMPSTTVGPARYELAVIGRNTFQDDMGHALVVAVEAAA